jgi:hypothetical protein
MLEDGVPGSGIRGRAVKRLRAGAPAALGVLALGLFYSWTASNGSGFGLGQPQAGHYNALADALLHRQLHLRVEPAPDLFEMAEPYEPGRNARVRLHDASLYHGRYYLYFGVVPVVVLFAPWALLGGGDLPEALAAVLFAVAGYVFFALLLRHLVRRHLPKTPRWARLIAYALLGLSSVVPFALRGASVYEVALTAGYAFAGAAAWLLATAGERGPLSPAVLAGEPRAPETGRPGLRAPPRAVPAVARDLQQGAVRLVVRLRHSLRARGQPPGPLVRSARDPARPVVPPGSSPTRRSCSSCAGPRGCCGGTGAARPPRCAGPWPSS